MYTSNTTTTESDFMKQDGKWYWVKDPSTSKQLVDADYFASLFQFPTDEEFVQVDVEVEITSQYDPSMPTVTLMNSNYAVVGVDVEGVHHHRNLEYAKTFLAPLLMHVMEDSPL